MRHYNLLIISDQRNCFSPCWNEEILKDMLNISLVFRFKIQFILIIVFFSSPFQIMRKLWFKVGWYWCWRTSYNVYNNSCFLQIGNLHWFSFPALNSWFMIFCGINVNIASWISRQRKIVRWIDLTGGLAIKFAGPLQNKNEDPVFKQGTLSAA